MQYFKLFYTDMPLRSDAGQPDLSLVLPLEFAFKEDALQQAFKLIHKGAIVWKIDGPGGFHLERAEIEQQYQRFKAA